MGSWGLTCDQFSGRGCLTTIGGGLTVLGLLGGKFDFAGSFSMSLFALIRGAFW
jgi:hypothetical protein